MKTPARLISTIFITGLTLALGHTALGFEVVVNSVDMPQCDTLAALDVVDELGPAPEGFPPDEQIIVDPAPIEFEDNCSGLGGDVGSHYELVIINDSGRDFDRVWFVADSINIWIGNYDGLVQKAPAMRIDRNGINQPLVSESIAADEIFEAGEEWRFRIFNWVFPTPPQLGSVGQVGEDSLISDNSNASIIALGEGGDDSIGITFSFDFPGPTNGMFDGFGFKRIFEGDIVTVTPPGIPGPNPPAPAAILTTPGLQIAARPPHFRVLNLLPGIVPNWRIAPVIELDALSYGNDAHGRLRFSVDEFAEGDRAPGLPNAVRSEGAVGAQEAAADTFDYRGTDAPPPPGGPTILFGNAHVSDGDGSGPDGVGLFEPNPPTPGSLPDQGDNLDALDFFTSNAELDGPVYFSLDTSFFDPIEGLPANSGSAAVNGFVGGDILVVFNTAPMLAGPFVYAPAAALGLDQIAGEDSDDLDALSLIENGDGVYTQDVDEILFSVRRGSAVIGSPDSRYGMPITPGDILQPPAPGNVLPAIYMPAEKLGLKTNRSGDVCAASFPAPPPNEPEQICDDLDALDRISLALLDSDNDGVTDNLDNCTYEPNASQIDTDGDNIGNRCDPDYNGDCTVSFPDLLAMRLAFFTNDANIDLDGDGTVNFNDLFIMNQFFFGPPGPSGLPNPCDCTSATLFGVTVFGGVVQIHRETGIATLLGNIPYNPNAAAVRSDDRIFVIDADELIEIDIDRVSGSVTSTVYWSLSGRPVGTGVRGMTFDASDLLHVVLHNSSGDLLYTVADAGGSGQFLPVGIDGNTGLDGLQSLAFDETGTLYTLDTGDGLYTLDTASASPTFVGDCGLGSEQTLEFDRAGTLLAARNELFEVDASCATPAVSVGPISDGVTTYDIRGLVAVH